ncbi:hypothetical protein H70357_20355 [Paenibacillus sp. FSL H7-0357]|uniref:hypothetical protein n=1 Tax=unclassified Paenibacillus TaxID=185978 RepID=UPI0004F8F481|nr:hypothetical protein [Paenibacillus sp. FSL H7-0357]AIQ18787.1 hypothetical protein H70357_20355 [Paenibacillus sp. FSL H7-0357]
MNNTYKVMENNTDFLTAALAQSKASVWYREDPDPTGHLMDYGGIVGGYSPETIKIAGSWFMRERFEFRAYIK